MSEPIVRRLRIHGRVQGVYYRGWAIETAEMLGVYGWVRNRMDGTVELLVAGSVNAVEAFIRACRNGPPSARVERVEIQIETADQNLGPGLIEMPTV